MAHAKLWKQRLCMFLWVDGRVGELTGGDVWTGKLTGEINKSESEEGETVGRQHTINNCSRPSVWVPSQPEEPIHVHPQQTTTTRRRRRRRDSHPAVGIVFQLQFMAAPNEILSPIYIQPAIDTVHWLNVCLWHSIPLPITMSLCVGISLERMYGYIYIWGRDHRAEEKEGAEDEEEDGGETIIILMEEEERTWRTYSGSQCFTNTE